MALLGGCAGNPQQVPRAADWPDARELRAAAGDAAKNPRTWAPLAGAALLAATGLDDSVSDWMADEAPLFGSGAGKASDRLRDAAVAGYLLTALARIHHQLPAADADALALRGCAPSSRFDVLSSTPTSSSGPRDQAGRRLDALTTKVGDGCGLAAPGDSAGEKRSAELAVRGSACRETRVRTRSPSCRRAGGRLVRLGVGVVTLYAQGAVVEGLKEVSSRRRPDRSDRLSFPSGHTGTASAASTMAMQNLAYIDMPPSARMVLALGFEGLAIGTGWARVEARKHFVADILAGYAVGHFLAAFAQGAFIDRALPGAQVAFQPIDRGGAIRLTFPVSQGYSAAR